MCSSRVTNFLVSTGSTCCIKRAGVVYWQIKWVSSSLFGYTVFAYLNHRFGKDYPGHQFLSTPLGERQERTASYCCPMSPDTSRGCWLYIHLLSIQIFNVGKLGLGVCALCAIQHLLTTFTWHWDSVLTMLFHLLLFLRMAMRSTVWITGLSLHTISCL